MAPRPARNVPASLCGGSDPVTRADFSPWSWRQVFQTTLAIIDVHRGSDTGGRIGSSSGVPRVKITQPAPSGVVSSESDDFDVDALIEPALLDALAALDGRAPLLAGMIRYHLGYAGRDLRPRIHEPWIAASACGPRWRSGRQRNGR